MTRAICRFCARVNPEGARFCNECGSPLTLVGCPHCEAINALDASRCHQCGKALHAVAHESNLRMRPQRANAGATIAASAAPEVAQLDGELDADPLATTPIALARRYAALNTRAMERHGPASDPMRDEPPTRADASAVDGRDEPRIADGAATPPAQRAAGADADVEPSFADVRTPVRRVDARKRSSFAPIVVLILLGGLGAAAYYLMPPAPTPVANGARAPAPPAAAPAAGDEAEPHDGVPVTQAPPAAPAGEARVMAAPAPSAAIAEPPMPAPSAAIAEPPAPAAAPASTPQHAAPPRPAHRSPRPAQSQLDKDALATQRLIERDLGGFLGPREPGAQR